MNSRLTRRHFIKGVIYSSAAATSGAGFYLANAASNRQPGAVERLIAINVNGRTRRVDVQPQETLAHTLRNRLNLTGTKVSCNRGECGSCTVLIDDTAIYSCSILTQQVKGKEITTVEGLRAADGSLHPVQQAFIDHGGFQCGICTPGQVIAAKSLLDNNSDPTEEEVREWMMGNLCRCTGYYGILESVMSAVRTSQESARESGS